MEASSGYSRPNRPTVSCKGLRCEDDLLFRHIVNVVLGLAWTTSAVPCGTQDLIWGSIVNDTLSSNSCILSPAPQVHIFFSK